MVVQKTQTKLDNVKELPVGPDIEIKLDVNPIKENGILLDKTTNSEIEIQRNNKKNAIFEDDKFFVDRGFQPLISLCDRCIYPVAQCSVCIPHLCRNKFYSPEPSILTWDENDSSIIEKLVSYKTSMCDFFMKNKCKKGIACTFAHSQSELRRKPDGFEIAKSTRKRVLPTIFTIEEEQVFKKKCLEKDVAFWMHNRDAESTNFEIPTVWVEHVKGSDRRVLHEIEKKTGTVITLDNIGRGTIRNRSPYNRKSAIEQIIAVLDFLKKRKIEKNENKYNEKEDKYENTENLNYDENDIVEEDKEKRLDLSFDNFDEKNINEKAKKQTVQCIVNDQKIFETTPGTTNVDIPIDDSSVSDLDELCGSTYV